jgi:hypothetical protein
MEFLRNVGLFEQPIVFAMQIKQTNGGLKSKCSSDSLLDGSGAAVNALLSAPQLGSMDSYASVSHSATKNAPSSCHGAGAARRAALSAGNHARLPKGSA